MGIDSISKITKHPLVRKVMTMLNSSVPEIGYFLTYLANDFAIVDDPEKPLMWVQHSFETTRCVFNVNETVFQKYFPNADTEENKVAAYALVTVHETLHLMSGHLSETRRKLFNVLKMNSYAINIVLDEYVNEMIAASFEPTQHFRASSSFAPRIFDRLVRHDKVVKGLKALVKTVDVTDDAREKAMEYVKEYEELNLLDSIEKRAILIYKILETLRKDQQQNGPGNSSASKGGIDDIADKFFSSMEQEGANPLSDHENDTIDENMQQEMNDLRRQVKNTVKSRSSAFQRIEDMLERIEEKDDELTRYLRRLAVGIAKFKSKISSIISNPQKTMVDVPKELINKRYMTIDTAYAWIKRPRKERPTQIGVNVFVDVSGSISYEELSLMLKNINHVVEIYAGVTNLYCWSSLPEDPIFIGKYKPGKIPSFDKFKTGYGTVLNSVLKFIVDNEKEHKNFVNVILTDGWVESDLIVLPRRLSSKVIFGLTDDNIEAVKKCNPGFVFKFRNKNDKHI